MNFTIQPLTAEDQSWVLALARSTQVYCPDCAQEHLALAAKDDGIALGYIAWQIALDEASLLGIAVQTFARRKHIGSALHQFSEQTLRVQAVKTLFLEVRQSNIAAQQFYEKIGYTQIAIRHNYYEALTAQPFMDKEHAVVMRKTL